MIFDLIVRVVLGVFVVASFFLSFYLWKLAYSKDPTLLRDDKGWKIKGVVFLIFLILVMLGLGYYGGLKAEEFGVICDVGVGDVFCWKWYVFAEEQVLDEVLEVVDEVLRGGGS